MRKLLTATLGIALSLAMSMTAFAGTWIIDEHEGYYHDITSTNWKYYDCAAENISSQKESYSVGWKQIDGKWYFFDYEGYMLKNCWLGNYYLGDDGAMLTNTTAPGGYEVGADGAMLNPRETVGSGNAESFYKVGDMYVSGPSHYMGSLSNPVDIWTCTVVDNTTKVTSIGGYWDPVGNQTTTEWFGKFLDSDEGTAADGSFCTYSIECKGFHADSIGIGGRMVFYN